ncbi:TPA: non-ribosomal peptide synthetase [Staphylococcus delphini]|nr:non-ribosomal peptide synthetase [Staphylococcus delphini]
MLTYRWILFNNLKEGSKIKDKIAIYSKKKNLTYREFYQRVSTISQNIIEKYGASNEIFAVRLENTFDAFILIWGLIFANKTILPLPKEIPDEKAKRIIKDINPIGIFFDHSNDYDNSIYFECFEVFSGSDFIPVDYSNENNFIVIMTSGTTGNAKGCCLTDESFLGRIETLFTKFGFCEQDNFLFSSNYSFDVSYTQIITWLFGMGSVTIQEKEDDFRSIPDYINSFYVTHIALSPAVLKYIYYNLVMDVKNLKEVFVAGEVFPKIIAGKYIENPPSFNLWNMYGPTEFSIYSTYFNLLDFDENDNAVPIGYKLDSVDLKLIDNSMNIIENDGVEGEILLGGMGRFSEYINSEKKTLDSLLRVDGQIYYKTGDIGSFKNQKLYFHGRKDQQLKINGIRVEAEEIEDLVIDKCFNIEDAVVTVFEHENKKQLVLFVVLRDKSIEVSISTVKDAIIEFIEPYFIPKVLFILKEIPINKNGKVDKKELYELYKSSKFRNKISSNEQITYGPKEKLTKIWNEVLNFNFNAENVDFFDLGADSIDVIVLLGEVKEVFKVELTVEEVYGNSIFNDMLNAIIIKTENNIIKHINKSLKNNKYNGYLKQINSSDNSKLVLYTDEDSIAMKEFIYNVYGIEFVPNIVLTKTNNQLLDDYKNYLMSTSEIQNLRRKISLQIERNNRFLQEALEKKHSNKYLCGPGQNKIFRKKYNDLVISSVRIVSIDEKKVQAAIGEVVKKHSLLRSVIIKEKDKYYFKEFNLRKHFEIDKLDLSEYCDYNEIEELVTDELFSVVAEIDKLNNLLYRMLLIKIDEKNYKLIVIFSHLIADAASANVFSKEIISSYNGVLKTDNISKYEIYLNELNENYSYSKYSDFITSEKYKLLLTHSNYNANTRDLEQTIIEIPKNVSRKILIENNENSKEGILLWLSSRLANIILKKEKITFRITNNGRRIANKNYSNILGDCHVHYPIIIDTSMDSISDCDRKLVEEFSYYYKENKIYLEDLSYSQSSEINNNVEKMFNKLDFVFNYLGEMDDNTSELYCRRISFDNTLFKTYYIYCYSNKNNLIINCRLPKSSKGLIVRKFISELGVNGFDK